MQDLDKVAMGRRIRQIRMTAKLRQWELAKLLGTTQSAVHKYEHGVIPEPRRLVELARIGGTSIEWVLTGSHWENGSRDQARVDPETLQTATLLRLLGEKERGRVDEALSILHDATTALDPAGRDAVLADAATGIAALRSHSGEVRSVLEAASRVHRAVLKRIAQDTVSRLQPDESADGASFVGSAATHRSRS